MAATVEFLKLLDKQEKDRRAGVKENLEKCKFRDWNDIAVGALP